MPFQEYGLLGSPLRKNTTYSWKNIVGGTLTDQELVLGGGTTTIFRSQNFAQAGAFYTADNPGWAFYGDGTAYLFNFNVGRVQIAANYISTDAYLYLLDMYSLQLFYGTDTGTQRYASFTAAGGVGGGNSLWIMADDDLFLEAQGDLLQIEVGGNGGDVWFETTRAINWLTAGGKNAHLGYSDGNNYITHDTGGYTRFRDGAYNEITRLDDDGIYLVGGSKRLDVNGGRIDMGGGNIYYSGTTDPSIRFTSTYIGFYDGGWTMVQYSDRMEVRATYLDANSYRFYGDTDTKIDNPSANTMRVMTGGVERMRFTSGSRLDIQDGMNIYAGGTNSHWYWWTSGTSTEVVESNAINTLTTGGAANVIIGSSGNQIRRSTSSIRYKPDWEFVDEEALAMLDLPTPIVWSEDPELVLDEADRTPEDTRQYFLGFGTEHVAERLPWHAVQDERGNGPELYDVRSLVAILSAKDKQKDKRLDAMEERVRALEEKLAALT